MQRADIDTAKNGNATWDLDTDTTLIRDSGPQRRAAGPARGDARKASGHLAGDQLVTAARRHAGLRGGHGASGFDREDALLVLGDNRPRLYIGMLAAGMLGGYAMPVFPDATHDEIRHFMHEADVRFVLAEDQEQVDKVLDLGDQGATIDHIVYDEPRGLTSYANPGLVSWDKLQVNGADHLRAEPKLRNDLIERAQPDGPAVFVHSSGTTGKPKGVVLTHRNLLAGVGNAYRGGAFTVRRDHPRLSADGLGRRLRDDGRRRCCAALHDQYSRTPGNGAARPARGRAHFLSGGTPQLGQHVDHHPGAHGGFDAAQEMALRCFHELRAGGRTTQTRGKTAPA